MQVVILATYSFGRAFGVVVVADEQTRRIGLLEAGNADSTLATIVYLVAIVIEQLDVEQRAGLAHGTGTRLDPRIGRQQHGTFGLAKALANLLAGEFLPLDGHLAVERLARSREVLDGREVVGSDVLLQHEAVHGRRRAEGREVVVLHDLQQLSGYELVHVVGEDRGTGNPLTVDLAPAELGPAAVGDAHVQAVLAHLLPVLGGEDVSERVLEAVLHGLGVARGAAREVDEHDVVDLGGVLARGALPLVALVLNELVEGQPAVAFARDEHLLLDAGRVGKGALHLLDHVVVIDADEHLNGCGVCAVRDVLRGELDGRRDDRGADLAQRHGAHPVFPATTQHHHHDVALADAELPKGVGGAVGEQRNVGERELALLASVVDPHEGLLLGFDTRPLVYDVVGEVEVLGHVDLEVVVEILVRVEFNAGAIFAEYVIHGSMLSLIT